MLLRRSALVLAGAGVLILAGCSGGATPGAAAGLSVPAGTSAQTTERHGWIPAAAKTERLLYVSDYTSSVVLIYKQGDTGAGPIGEIAMGVSDPEGIAVDNMGTLYVTNDGNNTITEYPAGSSSPSVTLSTDISSPLDVSVDSHRNVYVTESSASMILEFKPGSTSPNVTVSLEHPSVATNSKYDLFVTHNQGSTGLVDRCKPLSTKCTDRGISVSFAQGIAIDLKGNLLVGSVFGAVIDIYAPGQTSPFRTIPVTNEQPAKLALNTNDTTLYMADPANFAVRLFDYASGNQTSSFTFGSADELEGVALFPGQKPGR